MNHPDTIALLRSAHKAGVPPVQYSVYAALLSFTNYRGMCHPGLRAIAKLCSIHKDTAASTVEWLADKRMIAVYAKPRAVNHYEILSRSKWVSVRSGRTVRKGNLSGSTDQFAVRSGRTVRKALLQRNCPTEADVIEDSAQGAVGNAVAFGEVCDEPSATHIDPHCKIVAFP